LGDARAKTLNTVQG